MRSTDHGQESTLSFGGMGWKWTHIVATTRNLVGRSLEIATYWFLDGFSQSGMGFSECKICIQRNPIHLRMLGRSLMVWRLLTIK